jgi:cytoplasmic polyadenylation element-binding protein
MRITIKHDKSEIYVILATTNEVTYTWSGQLPPRHYKNPTYSTKVFLGGVPWDITESMYTSYSNFM